MFEVGEGFGSYEELEEKIQLIRKENFIDLWKRDSRTITAAQKRLTKELNPKLKYYEVYMLSDYNYYSNFSLNLEMSCILIR